MKLLFPYLLIALCSLTSSLGVLKAQTIISASLNLEDTSQLHVIHTQRGDKLLGRVTSLSDKQVTFILGSTQQVIPFSLAELTFIGPADETPQRRIPTDGQPVLTGEDLFYSATGFNPEKTGVYRNTMLFLNTIDFALGKYASVGGGIILPVLINIKAKISFPVKPFLHLGVATTNYFVLIDNNTRISHVYGVMTLGERERFINVGLGYLFDPVNNNRFPALSLGGSYTFNARNRLYAELGYYYDRFDSFVLPSLHYSLLRGRNKFDLSAISVPAGGSFIPIPLVSYYRVF